jgi:heme oxygenase
MADYAAKYVTARQRILEAMLGLNWVSWRYLRTVGGVRYGARLRELKRQGYQIIDQSGTDEHGKQYRLLSPKPYTGQQKQVKIYLPENEVTDLLETEMISAEANRIITLAYRIFDANRDKL